jgi:hypothetical protein
LAVSCLQPPCFVGVTNVGCRYLPRQPRTIRSRSAETVALKRAFFFWYSRAVVSLQSSTRVESGAVTVEWWRCWRSLAEPVCDVVNRAGVRLLIA